MGGEEAFECDNEGLQFLRSRAPDDVFVHIHVIVDHLVTHADDGLPGNGCVGRPEARRDLPCGLTDELKKVRERQSQVFVSIEILA
jgi:hypothetical protein